MPETFSSSTVLVIAVGIALVAYLIRVNQLFRGTPKEVQELSPKRWSAELLHETYKRLESNPISTSSYAAKIPAKLERRYIVTGGSGECRLELSMSRRAPGYVREFRDAPPGRGGPAGLENESNQGLFGTDTAVQVLLAATLSSSSSKEVNLPRASG